jgi:hypothetical protein
MNTLKSLADYRALARSRRFTWTGEALPANVKTKTRWQCKQGHSWGACYSDIRKCSGCPKCSGKKPKEAADYHALARARGFTWTGNALPANVMTKTGWQCKDGHSWNASYSNIQKGTGCPDCSGKRPRKVADYRALARSRGFIWTGKALPGNVLSKTSWQCEKEHSWQAPYNAVQNGRGCPKCFRKRVRKGLAHYHLLARARGFRWTGKALPQNTHTKTSWRCKKGHRWQTCYGNIQQGSGCRKCWRLYRLKLQGI